MTADTVVLARELHKGDRVRHPHHPEVISTVEHVSHGDAGVVIHYGDRSPDVFNPEDHLTVLRGAPRYATVVATVRLPEGYTTADLGVLADLVTATLVQTEGCELVGCDWAPDLDTVAEAIGADFGTVALVDLNPPR